MRWECRACVQIMTSGQYLSKITGTCRAGQSCGHCRRLVAQADRSTQKQEECS